MEFVLVLDLDIPVPTLSPYIRIWGGTWSHNEPESASLETHDCRGQCHPSSAEHHEGL